MPTLKNMSFMISGNLTFLLIIISFTIAVILTELFPKFVLIFIAIKWGLALITIIVYVMLQTRKHKH